MTKTAIKSLLAESGIAGVVTTQRLADALNLSVRTVNGAKNRGELHQLDRNAYDVDSIVEWLFAHPRYCTKINQKD